MENLHGGIEGDAAAAVWLPVCAMAAQALSAADAPTEYQVKAVFRLQFLAFRGMAAAGIRRAQRALRHRHRGQRSVRLDAWMRRFAASRSTAIRSIVRRFRNVGEVGDCQILFIDRSESARLGEILAALDHRSIADRFRGSTAPRSAAS